MRQKMRTTVTKLGIALVAWIGGRGNAHPLSGSHDQIGGRPNHVRFNFSNGPSYSFSADAVNCILKLPVYLEPQRS
jgi:hypothetical protein